MFKNRYFILRTIIFKLYMDNSIFFLMANFLAFLASFTYRNKHCTNILFNKEKEDIRIFIHSLSSLVNFCKIFKYRNYNFKLIFILISK